jgi:hypothetical protein
MWALELGLGLGLESWRYAGGADRCVASIESSAMPPAAWLGVRVRVRGQG